MTKPCLRVPRPVPGSGHARTSTSHPPLRRRRGLPIWPFSAPQVASSCQRGTASSAGLDCAGSAPPADARVGAAPAHSALRSASSSGPSECHGHMASSRNEVRVRCASGARSPRTPGTSAVSCSRWCRKPLEADSTNRSSSSSRSEDPPSEARSSKARESSAGIAARVRQPDHPTNLAELSDPVASRARRLAVTLGPRAPAASPQPTRPGNGPPASGSRLVSNEALPLRRPCPRVTRLGSSPGKWSMSRCVAGTPSRAGLPPVRKERSLNAIFIGPRSEPDLEDRRRSAVADIGVDAEASTSPDVPEAEGLGAELPS